MFPTCEQRDTPKIRPRLQRFVDAFYQPFAKTALLILGKYEDISKVGKGRFISDKTTKTNLCG
jgi:hypothetical protein